MQFIDTVMGDFGGTFSDRQAGDFQGDGGIQAREIIIMIVPDQRKPLTRALGAKAGSSDQSSAAQAACGTGTGAAAGAVRAA